jgi:hypothetical protein
MMPRHPKPSSQEHVSSQRVCETLDAETHQLHYPPARWCLLLRKHKPVHLLPRLVHVTPKPQTAKSDTQKPVSGLRRLLLGNPALGPARDGSGGLLLVHCHRPGVSLRRLLPTGRPAPGATGSSRGGSIVCGVFAFLFSFFFFLSFSPLFFAPTVLSPVLFCLLLPLRVTLRLAQTGCLVGSTFSLQYSCIYLFIDIGRVGPLCGFPPPGCAAAQPGLLVVSILSVVLRGPPVILLPYWALYS